MALYAIGDLHLSLAVDKSMEIFGPAWENYVFRIEEGLSVLRPEDTLILAGDTSWGMTLEAEAPPQGQPRLLVDHCRQAPPFF